jgi:nicotinate-nucleotide pyrophosphorylase (carboxylating)
LAEVLGREEVRWALAEDQASEDVTTQLLGAAAERPVVAQIIAEAGLVVAGLPVAAQVFRELDSHVDFSMLIGDGAWARAGAAVARVRASARAMLAGERVALNFLQRLSGIATLTRRAVDAVAGTRARITHTRKTTPGLRALECYAVGLGGGVPNRSSLAEAVLWKDNHWAIATDQGKKLRNALATVHASMSVIVEVETDAQLEAALAAGVTHILADNQSPEQVAAWVRRAGPAVTFQASGAITPESVRAYALAGAKLIALGALTHSAPAAPMRLDVCAATPSQ